MIIKMESTEKKNYKNMLEKIMYKTDKAAILMATYNSGKYINEQIESILNQCYTDTMLYIHDDGSRDSTKKIISDYSEKYPDKIVIIEGKPTGNATGNFFFLMNQVEAPYYMFSDQDDVWLEDKVDITYHKMKEMAEKYSDEKPLLVSTDLKVVNEKLNVISESMREYSKIKMAQQIATNKLLIQNYAVGCTLMLNRKLRDMAIGSENDKIVMHDWWLALIANIFGHYENIDRSTILYRQHGGNEVGADNIGIKYSLGKIGRLKKNHEIIQKTRDQAAELCRSFKVDDKVVLEYSILGDYNKIYRIFFHLKNGINKQGIPRKIGILICS